MTNKHSPIFLFRVVLVVVPNKSKIVVAPLVDKDGIAPSFGSGREKEVAGEIAAFYGGVYHDFVDIDITYSMHAIMNGDGDPNKTPASLIKNLKTRKEENNV
jgi:hypothetical protein